MLSTYQTLWHTVGMQSMSLQFCYCGSYDSQAMQPLGFQYTCKGQLEMGSQIYFTFDRIAILFSWTC